MFQFRAFPSYAYLIQRTIPKYCSGGFPHSEISGSTDICSSPKLIAACHVLRRLLMPRHSPCALYSLTLRDILVLLFGIMQAINRLLSQNCNCYPHLFRCSTIKISQTSSNFCWKTSLLPCFHHILHCSVFKVQFPIPLQKSDFNTQHSLNAEIQPLNWWWAQVDSNHRPYDYQSYALASWATGPYPQPRDLCPLN